MPADSRPGSTPPVPLRGIAILVVDEAPGVLDAVRQSLERLGALVSTAGSSEAAMCAAAIHRPHLVLLDVDGRNMHGFELARRLRQDAQFARTRLVATTSRPDFRGAMKGWSIEFDGRMRKPITPEALTALAQHVSGGRPSSTNG
jgi:two-component system, OmpR family, alkaline phosphatase synthesis response regulator PhoP